MDFVGHAAVVTTNGWAGRVCRLPPAVASIHVVAGWIVSGSESASVDARGHWTEEPRDRDPRRDGFKHLIAERMVSVQNSRKALVCQAARRRGGHSENLAGALGRGRCAPSKGAGAAPVQLGF